MSSLGDLLAWNILLPQGVEICAGPVLTEPPASTQLELASAGAMDAGRLLEFKTGRAYARAALSRLGFDGVELPVGANRVPVWPAGAIGSIAHTTTLGQGYVVAAVARAGAFGKIGIDAEFNRGSDPRHWPQFLTGIELQYVRSLLMRSRLSAALAIWCAKEAVIKAIGEPVDPLEIEVHHGQELTGAGEEWWARSTRLTTDVCARTIIYSNLMLAAAIA